MRAIWGNDDQAIQHLRRAQYYKGLGRTWQERIWGEQPDSSRVQFYTDKNGTIHPMRASYTASTAVPS